MGFAALPAEADCQGGADHGGLFLIFKRLIHRCWFCTKWSVLLGAIGVAVAAVYLHERVDEEIRCRVVATITEHYRGLTVAVRSAGRTEEGIEIGGLSILEPGAQGPRAELLHCDEILLGCSTDLQELLWGDAQITQITLRRPTLRVTCRPDGTLSTSQLLPLPQLSQRPPEVTIEHGTIEIYDPTKSPPGMVTLRDVNLTLSAPDPSSPTPNARSLQGTLGADYLEQVHVEGTIDPSGQSWTLAGTIDGLDVSPEMRQALPEPLAAKLAVLSDLRGEGSMTFKIVRDPAAAVPDRFDFSGRLLHGRINDKRLPHPLTDVRATFHLNNAGFAIDGLYARSGQTTLRIPWVRQAGLQFGRSPLALAAEVRNLQLDPQLRDRLDALPDRLGASLQEQWDKYRPTGRVNANVEFHFDGQAWRPQLDVECLDVSFTHNMFNYRLDKWRGNVTLKDDVLDAHLNTTSRNCNVRIAAKWHNASRDPFGWFEAEGSGLDLDDKLLDALKGKSREAVASLNPRGSIDFFRLRLQRDAPNGPLHKNLWLSLKACSVRYDRFPYPIHDIYGVIEMHDDLWTLHGVRGRNDTGWIICDEGYITPPERGQELFLKLVGKNVQLEPELRDALPPNVKRLWNSLRPQGTVNLLADIRYRCPTKQLSIAAKVGMGVPVELLCGAAPPDTMPTDPVSVRPVSIDPVHFPYRMEDLRGVLEYRDRVVTLHPFQARHGRVTMTGSGHCEFRRNGSWDFQLDKLTVDQLHLRDPELIQALPERLKRAVVALNSSGPIHLRGSFGMEGPARVGDPVRSRWNLAINLHQGSIDPGIKLQNINGSMALAGGFDGRRFHCRGELDVDSLTYKDYQFTEVRGPVWIDDQQVLLGSWVGRRRNRGAAANTRVKLRPLTARLFGGIVTCDPWITFGPQSRYALHATLSQASLSRWAQEAMVGRQDLKGKIRGTVDLQGTGRSVNALAGRGSVHLSEADIYELPVMISLLSILSIRRPDTTAFSKGDIDFRVQGNHIYLERIDFNGDAISLLGQGEMDFQHNVDLTFHAVVGRDEFHIPVLRQLVGGASQQIMQIRVDGTLQDPRTERVALPAVKEALQQLQGRRAHSPGRLPQTQRAMPPSQPILVR